VTGVTISGDSKHFASTHHELASGFLPEREAGIEPGN